MHVWLLIMKKHSVKVIGRHPKTLWWTLAFKNVINLRQVPKWVLQIFALFLGSGQFVFWALSVHTKPVKGSDSLYTLADHTLVVAHILFSVLFVLLLSCRYCSLFTSWQSQGYRFYWCTCHKNSTEKGKIRFFNIRSLENVYQTYEINACM